MPRLVEYYPKTLAEYVEQIEKLRSKIGHPLWHRGAGSTAHRLEPTLYRHPKSTDSLDFQRLERELMLRFRQRGLPYHSRNLSDDWEALFFMQHYGVPTRLLDWTENPLVGLYFALMSASPSISPTGIVRYSTPAAVWILDPNEWNETALAHVSYKGGPLSTTDDLMKGFSPSAATAMNSHPVALFGTHNSPRIVAQQGVFTIFGTNRVPMERLVRSGQFLPSSLSRVVISPRHIPTIRASLLNQGMTESTVFPDLNGLAKETKRHFGFEA